MEREILQSVEDLDENQQGGRGVEQIIESAQCFVRSSVFKLRTVAGRFFSVGFGSLVSSGCSDPLEVICAQGVFQR